MYPFPQFGQTNIPSTPCYTVNNIEEAKNFNIMPGQTILLMDSQSPIIYRKSMNNNSQISFRAFKLTELSNDELLQSQGYVTRNEMNILNNKLDSLMALVKGEKKDESIVK